MIKSLILINPCVSNLLVRGVLAVFFKNKMPATLLILSGLTPKEYKVKIVNQKVCWRKRDFLSGAIVGITCVTNSASQAYALADRFHRAGSRVVMGGPHVTAMPQEALRHCDSVVIGEAESVWHKVLEDFEKDALQRIYHGAPVEDFLSLSFAYLMSLDPVVLYRSGVNIVRGCKYHCDFCGRLSVPVRYAKIEQVISLISRMKQAVRNPLIRRPYIIFNQESNLYSDPAYVKEFFKALAPLKIRWTSQVSLDIAFDPEALRLAKASGCELMFFGFETIHPERFPKTSTHRIVSTDDLIKAIKRVRSFGIRVVGSFIIGLDDYTHWDYLRLIWFLARARFYFTPLTILTPYPGTKLFERLKKEGRLLTQDWRLYDLFHVVFRPQHMSVGAVMVWFIAIRTISYFCSPFGLLLTAGVMFGSAAGEWVVGSIRNAFELSGIFW